MNNKAGTAVVISFGVALAFASSQAFGGSHTIHGGVINFRSTLDVPWDWAHRYPPNFLANPGTPPAPPAVVQIAQPRSGNINFTYTYDVPWDWAHRYPPSFFASPPEPTPLPVARVPGCRAQDVTVGAGDGKQQTITMVRC